MSHSERTLVLVKPDGVQRQLVGQILARLEAANLSITALELRYPEQRHVEQHYQEHQDKPFFGPLVEYLTDSPVIAAVLAGEDAIHTTRRIIGDTDPANADSETIRGELGVDSMDQADDEGRALRNLIHASADPEDAGREIPLWFPDHEPAE
ncbi:nucleoside diphosphate kinase [Halohasta litchfieldiae]|jgi:nucleoside-diphosphate kinase|uniref:Nucleoside diphosphate kinase n=1 Tax=Halohasta litchfieldiae TaxID=1073996 RepID=A0A1H6SF23_9EURY|nr:nucleoside-diphosphate kinase [Halohasta litchfieldiae]ATW87901.1 nucleoside diphosphate kinase [Halohasta litchfieldiae]SEI62620.1 nucleoside diphosphate kinase [Halohasta litchfieldiae]